MVILHCLVAVQYERHMTTWMSHVVALLVVHALGLDPANSHVDRSAIAVDKLVPVKMQLGRRPAPGWLVWGAVKHACYV